MATSKKKNALDFLEERTPKKGTKARKKAAPKKAAPKKAAPKKADQDKNKKTWNRGSKSVSKILGVRTTLASRKRIDRAAKKEGFNAASGWARDVLEKAADKVLKK